MTKFLTAAALIAAIAAPAFAKDAPAQRSFVRDGQTYVYTATVKGSRTFLVGKAYPSNTAFELTVRDNRVSGKSGGVPVAFNVAEATKSKATVLASR